MIDYEVCSEEYLNNIKQVNPNSLSLDEEVFHIIGRPDRVWIVDSYCDILKYKTKDLYDLLEKKGGRCVRKEESKNITCIIFGAQPSVRAIKEFEGRAKFISAENAITWLEKQNDINPACGVFDKKYRSSGDNRLRPYQQYIKDRVFKIWNYHYNVLVQLPTGTGKTVLFTSIINDLAKVKGVKIVILAHRKELIEQISEHLSHYNIEHGLITSGRVRRLDLSVQVASVQTLTHDKNIDLLHELKPQFIIIDEAHHSLADSYTKFWKECGDCWKLGVTATPYRLNLHSFRTHFDKFVESDTIDSFIDEGYLSDYDFYTDNPNSSLSRTIESIKEKSSTRDYKTATLLKELNIEEHIQRLIVCYEQYVKGKKGIVYAINKEHAHNICNAYQIIGVNAVYIDSDTPKGERQDIVERFRKSEVQVMVNVDIFSEGFDCPDVEFIQLARPTWSLGKYLQQVGRGMRPCENKQKTVILDNSRMFVKFGFPSERRSWLSYFNGEYWLKDYQGVEDEDYKKQLRQANVGRNEIMVKLSRSVGTTEKTIKAQIAQDESEVHYQRIISTNLYNAKKDEIKREHNKARQEREKARKEQERIERHQYILDHTPIPLLESPYFEKNVCVNGDFEKAGNGDAIYIIKSLGAKVTRSVTSKTEIAFIGEYTSVDWAYLVEEIGLHPSKYGDIEMNAAIEIHDKIYPQVLGKDSSVLKSPFYKQKVTATGQLSWLLKDCNLISDLFNFSASIICSEDEEDADIYILGLSTDLSFYKIIKEKITGGKRILLLNYEDISQLRDLQNLILSNFLSLKPAFSEDIINQLSVYFEKWQFYTNRTIKQYETEKGIWVPPSPVSQIKSKISNFFDHNDSKGSISTEKTENTLKKEKETIADVIVEKELVSPTPQIEEPERKVVVDIKPIDDSLLKERQKQQELAFKKRQEERKRREEQRRKDYEARKYQEELEAEEAARKEQQKKIYAAIGAAIVTLILIYFFGLLGPAILGLIFGGFLAKK